MATRKKTTPPPAEPGEARSEAVRRLARYLIRSRGHRAALEAELGLSNGYISALLRGRRRTPGAAIMLRFQAKLRIPIAAWTQPARAAVPEVPRYL